MGGDDDIAASLPRPPFPAPARREAAIDSALRRFDGAEARPAGADRRPERSPFWGSGPVRPYAGALAGALIVALVGLPWVWTSIDPIVPARERRPATEARSPEPARAAAGPAAALDEQGADPKAPAAATEAEPSPAAKAPSSGPPSSPAVETDGPAARFSEESAADSARAEAGTAEIVVTGSRIRRPNLESAVPITSIGGEEFFQTGQAARRGDWNACTIDDPKRDLSACRRDVASVARGASGKASAHVAEGLTRAWDGELEDAVGAFDLAIAAAPRSSSAYLNRGLARKSLGDLDRALADLDQAVRLAPDSARAYYHRGQIHRQRGNLRRARADEKRAGELDPNYAPLVRRR